MAEYTIQSINTAIVDTLATATGIKRAQDLDGITDNIPEGDLPLLMVFPDSSAAVSADSETQTMTFGGGSSRKISQRDWTYNCDLYVSRRSIISQSMPDFALYTQALLDILEAQPTSAPFGTDAISSFVYSWERVTINYSSADYDACRFTITVRIY